MIRVVSGLVKAPSIPFGWRGRVGTAASRSDVRRPSGAFPGQGCGAVGKDIARFRGHAADQEDRQRPATQPRFIRLSRVADLPA